MTTPTPPPDRSRARRGPGDTDRDRAEGLLAATTEAVRRLRAQMQEAESRGDRAEAERLRADLEIRVELAARLKRGIRDGDSTREVR